MGARKRRPRLGWAAVVGAALMVAGAVVALLGAVSLLHSARLAVFGRRAVATVVDRTAQPARRGPVYWTTLEFVAEDGVRRRVKADLASRGESFELGAEVYVRYLPSAPERAEVWDGRLQWFGRGVVLLLGGMAALFGWALMGSGDEGARAARETR